MHTLDRILGSDFNVTTYGIIDFHTLEKYEFV